MAEVTRDAFVDQEDSQGRYTLKPAFKSSFVPGVERVLMIPEVRHAQPKIAKMTTKKWLM